MTVASQSLLTTPHTHSRIGNFCYYSHTRFQKPRIFPLSPKPFTANPLRVQAPRTHFPNWVFPGTRQLHSVNSFQSDAAANGKALPDYEFNFDAVLSVIEFICLATSAAVSIALAVNSWFFGLGNRVLVGQCVVLVGAMVIGAVIRKRQWRRICNVDFSRSSNGSTGVNLVERIEKLEEDLRSSTTIIRVLSRQLEKLGTRFRVTRRTLKDPITETAALAQKNSEATRALAVQGEILEKELGEIQNVLFAMQDQQQKQLELILAIGKTSKLFDNSEGLNQDRNQNQNAPNTMSSVVDGVNQDHNQNQNASNNTMSSVVDGVPKVRLNQMQTLTGHEEANSDQV